MSGLNGCIHGCTFNQSASIKTLLCSRPKLLQPEPAVVCTNGIDFADNYSQ